MSAIGQEKWLEELSEWMAKETVTSDSHRLMSDSLESRAILELADRLRSLEGDVRELAGKVTPAEDEPFRVTGPGLYQRRDGRIASVTSFDDHIRWPACGDYLWTASGRYRSDGQDDDRDLVSYVGPLPAEQPAPKRITGWINIYNQRGFVPKIGPLWRSKDSADSHSTDDGLERLACVYIDVPEGHGIERGDGA